MATYVLNIITQLSIQIKAQILNICMHIKRLLCSKLGYIYYLTYRFA